MTGHLEASGASGNLNVRNEQIRQYCRTNNKILYDFADIESYDPDGLVNYMPLFAEADCTYDADDCGFRCRNWATDWQNSHTENVDWYSCVSAPQRGPERQPESLCGLVAVGPTGRLEWRLLR